MTEPSDVQRASERFKAALLRNERAAASDMVRAYGGIWRRVKPQLDALLKSIDEAERRGEEVKPSDVARSERLRLLLAQIEQEVGQYAQYADASIRRQQSAAIEAAGQHAEALTRAAMGADTKAAAKDEARLALRWNRLPREAMIELTGQLASGAPLDALLGELGPDAAQKVKDALLEGLAMGRNPRVIARDVRRGMGMPLTRSLRIARTEVLRSYRRATLANYAANSDIIVGWKWSASHSSRTCLACLAMDGKVFPLDKPMPAHVNCFVGETVVSAPGVLAATSRWYTGEVLDVETVGGYHFTVTPNHPVLTPQGWVAAGLLHEGSDIVSSGDGERVTAVVYPDDYNRPTAIQQIVETLRRARGVVSRRMPVAAIDFHGDGVGSDVDVVYAHRLLVNHVNAALLEHGSERQFVGGSMRPAFLASLCPEHLLFYAMDATTAGSVGSSDVASVLFGSASGHHQAVGLGGVTSRYTGAAQASSDDATRDAKGIGQGLLRFTGDIADGDFVLGDAGLSEAGSESVSDGKAASGGRVSPQTAFLEGILETLLAGSEAPGSVLDALASHIRIDRVLKVGIRSFSGHVYNLQTATGWYIANGIVAHNCRCSQIPITASWRDLGVDAPDVEPGPTGAEWFARQPESVKREMLGDEGYTAYRTGKVTLDDFVGVRKSRRWGDAVVEVNPL